METESQIQRTDKQLLDGRRLGDWVEKRKELSLPPKKTPHRHRQQYGNYWRERGWGRGVEEGRGGQMVMEEDLIWGGEHAGQCTDDVLQNRTPDTYTLLITNVSPINSIKI